jgi:hypothetical protein
MEPRKIFISALAGLVAGLALKGVKVRIKSDDYGYMPPEPNPLPDPYKLDPFSRTMRIMGEIVAVGSLAVVLMLWGFVIAMQFVYAFNILFK